MNGVIPIKAPLPGYRPLYASVEHREKFSRLAMNESSIYRLCNGEFQKGTLIDRIQMSSGGVKLCESFEIKAAMSINAQSLIVSLGQPAEGQPNAVV